MKAFDHAKPANRPEWIFAFVAAYRELRPEIGERYATTNAQQAYVRMREMEPRKAAQAWMERSR